MVPVKAPGDVGSAMSQKTNLTSLTNVETARITQARQNSTKMRSEPQLPNDKSASLLVTEGLLKGKIFPIKQPQMLIGRSGADVVIVDPQVSRNHCVLEIHNSNGLLVDLDSANGTFVDDKKVATCELGHLSEFRIGSTTLMFVLTNNA